MSEKTQYIKSAFISYSGKIITILSNVAYTLLIANFLGPEKYGLVNYYISFTLGLMGTFGIYFLGGLFGVFMPKWKSKRFFKYSFFVVSIVSFLIFLVLYVFSEDITIRLAKVNYELLRTASILLLVIPFTLLYTSLFRSFKMFGKELKFNLIVAVVNLSLAFLLVVVYGYGAFGVVYAMIFSNFIGLLFLLFHYKHLKFLERQIDFSAIKTYSKFGIPASFLHRIDNQIILLFMGLFIADNDLGLYYVALKIASVVLSTPIRSMTEVLLPYISDSVDKNKLSRYVSINIRFSLIITIILSIFVIIFSKYILLFFFPKYVASYYFIVFLTLSFIVSSLTPLYTLFQSLNRMDVIAKSYFGGIVSTVIFGLLIIPHFGVFGLILTQTLNALTSRSILVYFLKSVNLMVEIIPKKEDFRYFWDSLKTVFFSKVVHK